MISPDIHGISFSFSYVPSRVIKIAKIYERNLRENRDETPARGSKIQPELAFKYRNAS